MMHLQQVKKAIAEALECSVFVNPREPGLTYDEIKEVTARAGFKEGEVGDAFVTMGLHPLVRGSKQPVTQTIDRVLDAAFRETPISVIDHCRNAMGVILSRWLVASGHDPAVLADDLGKIATIVVKTPYEKGMAGNLAGIVARLHSRGKTNEAHIKGLRDPVEEDAELALHAVGFTLRDVGWADLGMI
jgi:hypothetical protein